MIILLFSFMFLFSQINCQGKCGTELTNFLNQNKSKISLSCIEKSKHYFLVEKTLFIFYLSKSIFKDSKLPFGEIKELVLLKPNGFDLKSIENLNNSNMSICILESKLDFFMLI